MTKVVSLSARIRRLEDDNSIDEFHHLSDDDLRARIAELNIQIGLEMGLDRPATHEEYLEQCEIFGIDTTGLEHLTTEHLHG